MLIGIVGGFFSAALQSSSYVLSRVFIHKYKDSFSLVVFSQLAMGVLGAATIPLIMPFSSYPLTWKFFGLMLLCVLTFMGGQYCFFQTLREIEASRLSSLLGLKIVILALISMLVTRIPLHFLQWLAIILCSVAAVGMNFTGGRITRKGAFWLLLMLISYSCCDLIETELILEMQGKSLLADSTAVAALMYLILGALTVPLLWKHRWDFGKFKAAVPYAASWYGGIILLFLCYGSLGAVFGNIIQSSRGIISVALGAWLLHLGYEHLEPRVDRKSWCRRFLMAVVMICAMCLYSYARMIVSAR